MSRHGAIKPVLCLRAAAVSAMTFTLTLSGCLSLVQVVAPQVARLH